MELRVLSRIAEIDAPTWDALVGDGCPFFEHAFLAAVETARCVGPGTGWTPHHLLLCEGGRPVAAAAAWIKAHSYAEFVFDWAWADAAARAGIPYYPKLVIAAPFSPVGGRRMHLGGSDRPELRTALAAGSLEAARRAGMSGVHWLFVEPDEAAALERVGFELRHTVQFHWRAREGERDFDGFLARFDSKKRHQIKRERRLVREAGVTARVLTGEELDPSLAPLLHTLYTSTVDKYHYGQRYLNQPFFAELLKTWRKNLMLVLAEQGPRVLGGAINAARNGVLYGRYWGGLVEMPFLHFEVCSYAGIEWCLRQGIARFEAGAGGGEHKHGRGFEPAVTRSAHWIFHPGMDRAVRAFLRGERAELERALGPGRPPR